MAPVTAPAIGPLRSTYAHDVPELVLEWQAAQVPAPELVALNESLADELGLDADALSSSEGVAMLAGNLVPDDTRPVALVYSGHQFGGFSPRLGDGRALLLGEIDDRAGVRHDLHLKGSGRTPFARGGDGKATIGPMLREFLIAEALHSLGVPTMRALAVATTGEYVQRNAMEPGAVLTRVGSSHIRVGTFEYAARLEDRTVLPRLADHAIDRHHPASRDADDPYLGLLDATIDGQAALIADWMLLGFIHGVMNTDNMTISGEGIDYGPCAFMDRFDPATVFSSIDHGGRYAYGNQPNVATWNLARFAETLVPLMDGEAEANVEAATASLRTFETRYGDRWRAGMQAKLGLVEPPSDGLLFDDLWQAMHDDELDVTGTFRGLARSLRGDRVPTDVLHRWTARWHEALEREGRDRAAVARDMDAVNPLYIPRNHLVEEALAAATAGDLEPFRRLLDIVTAPYEERPGADRHAQPADPEFTSTYRTFCGT